MDRAEFFGFLGGFTRELAGHQIIRFTGGHQIHGDHGKLGGGATLNEADFVIVRNVQNPTKRGLGFNDDGIVHTTAMTHLHNGLTG